MIITDSTIKVLTGPNWLFELFKGFKNTKETAMIDPIIDPNGSPILGKNILTSTDFNVDIEITNPVTGLTTTPRAEMWEIDYCYWEQIE